MKLERAIFRAAFGAMPVGLERPLIGAFHPGPNFFRKALSLRNEAFGLLNNSASSLN